MMNPFLVQSPHREPEPESEPEPQSQSETCAIKVSDKDQEKADDNSLSLTSTPTTEATATTTAVTTTTDPIDSFQVWNIMPNQSRSGVVTWSTDDGNILLRMTFHPKDKMIGVNSQIDKKYTREETFPFPESPTAISIAYHTRGFTILAIPTEFTVAVAAWGANIRREIDMQSEIVGTLESREDLVADDVGIFNDVVERYHLKDGRGWVSRNAYIPGSGTAGDTVLTVKAQKLVSGSNMTSRNLFELSRDFAGNECINLKMNLPDDWHEVPYDIPPPPVSSGSGLFSSAQPATGFGSSGGPSPFGSSASVFGGGSHMAGGFGGGGGSGGVPAFGATVGPPTVGGGSNMTGFGSSGGPSPFGSSASVFGGGSHIAGGFGGGGGGSGGVPAFHFSNEEAAHFQLANSIDKLRSSEPDYTRRRADVLDQFCNF